MCSLAGTDIHLKRCSVYIHVQRDSFQGQNTMVKFVGL